MASYMDVVTVLLILFVALSAQALQHPQKKSEPPAPALPVIVLAPSPLPALPLPAAQPKLTAVQTRLAQLGLDSQLEPRGLVISLPQAILFAPGQDLINKDARATVGRIAGVLRDIPNRASLIGHADTTPIHNSRFHNNWELSAARSLRLLEMLTNEYGLPESRLAVASYGAFSPQAPNDTPDGRASNRRVEIVISEEDGGNL
jgi:flagellar motor protein MotB